MPIFIYFSSKTRSCQWTVNLVSTAATWIRLHTNFQFSIFITLDFSIISQWVLGFEPIPEFLKSLTPNFKSFQSSQNVVQEFIYCHLLVEMLLWGSRMLNFNCYIYFADFCHLNMFPCTVWNKLMTLSEVILGCPLPFLKMHFVCSILTQNHTG
jgi:hypothetical protein